MKNLKFLLLISIVAFLNGCGCDSQSPDDVEEQFDPDTIRSDKPADSTLSEKMYPMNTDSIAGTTDSAK
ncbi:hypothetical protein [Olivibacter sp. XZL3]|uniref:hypothetical protein n=1 Tax=Olivibacter sp. XZL3 TaxID=1735116 RepID=UPI00106482DB|nr:hypothetical protein [Olivibacter sp. XZL3]